MADLSITQLPSASIATGSNVLPIVQGGVTDQITVTNLAQGMFNLNLSITGSFTGSLIGTSSFATNHAVVTSSYICNGILNANQTFATGSDAVIAFVDYNDPNNWLTSNQFKPTIAGYYNVSFGAWLQKPSLAQ